MPVLFKQDKQYIIRTLCVPLCRPAL